MTQEEKAKAYDEAIKKAGERYNEEYTSTLERSTLAYVFPELKESDDEKIRKSLIILLQHFCKGYRVSGLDFPVSYKDMLAWLEKQGEQKPSWSEEDEGMLRYILECLKNGWRKLPTDILKYESWLKSLKDRVQPQPKSAGWSEEDKNMIYKIRNMIFKYAFSQSAVDVNGDLCEKEYIEADGWMESLRLQNTWKPSDEQMEALTDAMDKYCGMYKATLCSLYNNLKEKLKR